MSYSGRFVITDEGIALTVELPKEDVTHMRGMVVAFTFAQIDHTILGSKRLMHSVIAGRVVAATRSLDDEED